MKVAVLGFGTVGVGVYEMLCKAKGFEPGPVLVRPGKATKDFMRTSIADIAGDPTIDAAVGAIGGVSPAFEYASAILSEGKHFVTSNKVLVAEKGIELSTLAYAQGAGFLFSAACGGAVPFLHDLSLARQGDKILKLGGILNGTTNYILDAMQRLSLPYSAALKRAKDLGYAENNPTDDLCGLDSLRKIMLACAVAYDMLPAKGLLMEGIESLAQEDVLHFKKMGVSCRLAAKGGITKEGAIYAYVEPALYLDGAPEGILRQNFNLAFYEGENCGRISLTGQGAGRFPTASAVLRDLSCIRSGRKYMLKENCRKVSVENEQCMQKYYVRFPETMASLLPAEAGDSFGCEKGMAGIITKPVSVAKMHRTAAEIRNAGGKIFFAGIEERP